MRALKKLPKLVILKGLLILAFVHVVFHKGPYKFDGTEKRTTADVPLRLRRDLTGR